MTPRPPLNYSVSWASDITSAIRDILRTGFRSGKNLEIGDARIILTAPNGTRFAVGVDNAGTVTTSVVND